LWPLMREVANEMDRDLGETAIRSELLKSVSQSKKGYTWTFKA